MFTSFFLLMAALSSAAEETTLVTPSGTLYGTLLIPSSPNPVPVVLIISGSGPTDRNGNSALLSGPNNSLRMLAEGLVAANIASLRYDKRGVGASAEALSRDFDLYVDDAVRWIAQLRNDSRFSSVVVAGHSEGSLIGIIAAEHASVDRLVSIDGAGRPAGDVILSQLQGQITPSLFERARQIVASLNAGVQVPNVPAGLYSYFAPELQPYLISLFRYDPPVELARLRIPLLVLHGSTDIQIPPSDARLLAAGNPAATLLIIDGMNHVLKDVPADATPNLAAYSDPTLPIDKKLLQTIINFANPQARRRAARTIE